MALFLVVALGSFAFAWEGLVSRSKCTKSAVTGVFCQVTRKLKRVTNIGQPKPTESARLYATCFLAY